MEKNDVARTVAALEGDLKRVKLDAEAFGRDLKLLREEKEKLFTELASCSQWFYGSKMRRVSSKRRWLMFQDEAAARTSVPLQPRATLGCGWWLRLLDLVFLFLFSPLLLFV